jgi:hypothetical protein
MSPLHLGHAKIAKSSLSMGTIVSPSLAGRITQHRT